LRIGLSFVPESVESEMIPEYALLAESKGFDSFWVPEHMMHSEAFSLLGAIAVKTKKIKLGSSVVSVLIRHPSVTAMAAKTLHKISGGRFILGLGIGDEETMKNSLGYSVDRPLEKIDEAVKIIRLVFSGGNDFSGKHFMFRDLRGSPLSQTPKIYIAAVGFRMLNKAAELGDGVIFSAFSSTTYIEKAVSYVKNKLITLGKEQRSFEFAGLVATAIGHDLTNLKRLAAVFMAYRERAKIMLSKDFLPPKYIEKLRNYVAAGDLDAAGDLIDEDLLSELSVFGSSKEIQEHIKLFIRKGLTLPIIYPVGNPITIINTLKLNSLNEVS